MVLIILLVLNLIYFVNSNEERVDGNFLKIFTIILSHCLPINHRPNDTPLPRLGINLSVPLKHNPTKITIRVAQTLVDVLHQGVALFCGELRHDAVDLGVADSGDYTPDDSGVHVLDVQILKRDRKYLLLVFRVRVTASASAARLSS